LIQQGVGFSTAEAIKRSPYHAGMLAKAT
jgi:hypothetical protein